MSLSWGPLCEWPNIVTQHWRKSTASDELQLLQNKVERTEEAVLEIMTSPRIFSCLGSEKLQLICTVQSRAWALLKSTEAAWGPVYVQAIYKYKQATRLRCSCCLHSPHEFWPPGCGAAAGVAPRRRRGPRPSTISLWSASVYAYAPRCARFWPHACAPAAGLSADSSGRRFCR